ncbi:MAG: DUF4349 domain-containing protein [Lachnospiraceae bacterium]|nr:DUF4349 domain-containing protein [Lachnospiraceae bacterium]
MKKKVLGGKILATALAASLVLGLTACGSADSATANFSESKALGSPMEPGAAMDYGYADVEMEEAVAESGSTQMSTVSSQNSSYYDSRKLIRTVELSLETKEFDLMLGLVEDKVAELGGYVESLQTYNGSRYSGREPERNSNLTVRIPKDKLDEFLNAVSEAGNVIRRSENVQDVTLEYVDMESRRNTLKTEQERLLKFLETAETLEDIIVLEERLSEVRYQLESMESQLRTYDNKVDFATVHMSIQEVKELTPVEKEGVGARLANGFMESLKNVGNGFVEFFIWIVVHLPYLATWALIITTIVMIIKFNIRRSRKKKALKSEKAAKTENAAKQKESEK